MSTLGTARLQAVELHWPTWGAWWARCSTEIGVVPPGKATLTIGDRALVGTVLPGRFGEGAPSSWSAIVTGGAAWSAVLKPRAAYQNDDGVRLKTVLGDLATECKATIVQPPDAPLGAYYARPSTGATRRPLTGKDALDALVRARILAGWWVDALDVTRFGPRPAGDIVATVRKMPSDPTRGVRVVGVDSVAPFVPGLRFEGVTVARMVIRETGHAPPVVELWDS